MVLDSDGESILNNEKSRLKANGVQEETKGIPLLAPSGHVGNELPMKQLEGEHSQTGAHEASRESVETVLVVQGEEDKVILGVED